jgi:hypothetical protein
MADLLSVLDWIAALLFAGAIGMIALTPDEIRVANILVWIAAISFGARWIMWAVITEYSWQIRAIVGAIVGAFLLGALPPALNWIFNKSAPQKIEDHTSIKMLHIQCTEVVYPLYIADDGKIYWVDLIENIMIAPFGIGFNTYLPQEKPKQAFKLPGYKGFPHVFQAKQCTITNYGNEPLFNINLIFHVDFYKHAVTQADDKEHYDIKSSNEWTLRPSKLDVGKDNAFTFYIINQSSNRVVASFHNKATAKLLSGEQVTVELIFPNDILAFLFLP